MSFFSFEVHESYVRLNRIANKTRYLYMDQIVVSWYPFSLLFDVHIYGSEQILSSPLIVRYRGNKICYNFNLSLPSAPFYFLLLNNHFLCFSSILNISSLHSFSLISLAQIYLILILQGRGHLVWLIFLTS